MISYYSESPKASDSLASTSLKELQKCTTIPGWVMFFSKEYLKLPEMWHKNESIQINALLSAHLMELIKFH